MNRKNIAIAGIIICCIYFATVVFFILSGSQNWLIIFEVVTMISGLYFIFLILVLPLSDNEKKKIYKILAIVFVSALMIFTNIVHITNLMILRLTNNGVIIPEYFQLGKNPSVITIVEYSGWGIFLGLAFLFSSIGIENDKILKPLKITLFICAMLCFTGFLGSIINEHLWYIASLGYGIGTLVICTEMIIIDRKERNKNDKA